MKKTLLITITAVSILTFTGCEVTVDTDKPFGFKIKDKSPVEVYKKGLVYCKLGELNSYTGNAFVKIGSGKDYFVLKNGLKNGRYYFETSNGKIIEEGNYINGKKDGKFFHYNYPMGFTSKEIYQNGKLLQEVQVNNNNMTIKRELTYKDSKPYEGYNYGYFEYAKENERYILELYKKGKFTLKYLTSDEFYKREKIKDMDKFYSK